MAKWYQKADSYWWIMVGMLLTTMGILIGFLVEQSMNWETEREITHAQLVWGWGNIAILLLAGFFVWSKHDYYDWLRDEDPDGGSHCRLPMGTRMAINFLPILIFCIFIASHIVFIYEVTIVNPKRGDTCGNSQPTTGPSSVFGADQHWSGALWASVGTMSIAIICKIIYLYKNRRRHHHPQVSGQTVTGGGGRAVSVASVTTTKSEASGGREAPKTENDALRNIQKTNKDITELRRKAANATQKADNALFEEKDAHKKQKELADALKEGRAPAMDVYNKTQQLHDKKKLMEKEKIQHLAEAKKHTQDADAIEHFKLAADHTALKEIQAKNKQEKIANRAQELGVTPDELVQFERTSKRTKAQADKQAAKIADEQARGVLGEEAAPASPAAGVGVDDADRGLLGATGPGFRQVQPIVAAQEEHTAKIIASRANRSPLLHQSQPPLDPHPALRRPASLVFNFNKRTGKNRKKKRNSSNKKSKRILYIVKK